MTSYPERLALSNKRTLSELIRDTITRLHHTPVEGEPEYIRAQKVVEDIVEKASQFEPKFTVCARERTFNNAFAGEIAHVVSSLESCQRLRCKVKLISRTEQQGNSLLQPIPGHPRSSGEQLCKGSRERDILFGYD